LTTARQVSGNSTTVAPLMGEVGGRSSRAAAHSLKSMESDQISRGRRHGAELFVGQSAPIDG
jgi:hypothetical protein